MASPRSRPRASCCCLCHCCCLHPDCGRHSCCCWHPLSSSWFTGTGLSAIADVPSVTIGVVDVSAVSFEHAVAGGPAVAFLMFWRSCWSWCPYFSWWLYILDCRMRHITLSDYQTIRLWLLDCKIFLLSNYQDIEYRIGEFKKLSDYRISE